MGTDGKGGNVEKEVTVCNKLIIKPGYYIYIHQIRQTHERRPFKPN